MESHIQIKFLAHRRRSASAMRIAGQDKVLRFKSGMENCRRSAISSWDSEPPNPQRRCFCGLLQIQLVQSKGRFFNRCAAECSAFSVMTRWGGAQKGNALKIVSEGFRALQRFVQDDFLLRRVIGMPFFQSDYRWSGCENEPER